MPPLPMNVFTDIACTACGCVCDDLRMTVAENRLERIEPPCPLATEWYRGINEATPSGAMIDGGDATFEEAVEHAAKFLRRANSPLIYGLSRSSTAGQRAAVALAEQLGATIDTTASMCHGPSIMAFQSVGESTSSLGEIRNRADLVIFWGCNPAVSHPRHAERYSVFPRGQFVPRGRADRTVVMIGDAREVHDWRLDRNGSCPDIVIPVEPDRDFEAITTLRTMLKGLPLPDTDLDQHQTGALVEDLESLVERMRSCRCGVVFFGLGLTGTRLDPTEPRSGLGHLNVEALLRLVAELNAVTRFYARRMRLQGGVSGADSVLCWQTGYPFSVNLARGYPRYNPSEFSADEMLSRGEVDACVLIGTETLDWFSAPAVASLRRIPTIVIDYPHVSMPFTPTVLFRTAIYGVHCSGTAYRMDEVPIPLRSFLDTNFPTDEVVLRKLALAADARV